MSFHTFLKCSVLVICLGLNTVNAAVIGRIQQVPKNSAWNYDDPDQWPIDFPTCGGERQSPIELDVATAVETAYPTLSFGKYDKVIPVESLTNNGHTIMLQIPEAQLEELPYIEGGGLTGRYNFHQLHFHWGSDTSRGSEHRISGQAFPGELHIVHYNVKYSNFATASGYPDGLAVLAVPIELETRDNIVFRHLEHFENLVLPDGPASNVPIPFPFEDLLPDSTASFFRYDGSLTTPECNESVIWTVFQTPIAISERQLKAFTQVQDHENRPLADNYRPVQSLNNRVVTYRAETTL